MSGFTHFDASGHAVMVDVSEKQETQREATAKGKIYMSPECFALVKAGEMKKGDVLGVARIAGIMGAKKTSELIPLCHILNLSKAEITFTYLEESCAIEAACTAKTVAKTGVEMEALTGVNIALLTIYDMCKAVDKAMRISDIRLCRKTGGKSGTLILESEDEYVKDSYGRVIDYMRISITDRCNLRCRYCMPDGIKSIPMEQILTLEEIAEVCQIASELGITKFKVTGGEPLVRKGCIELIHMLKALPHTEQVTLTTNGILLAVYAKELKEAGLDGVNVSLDTLCAEKFAEITGYDRLKDVLEGIRTAHALGLKVKINTVLQKGVNEGEWEALLQIAKETPIDIRFIEMMPIGHGSRKASVSNQELLEKIRGKYGEMTEEAKKQQSGGRGAFSGHGNGPAVYYQIPGFQGSVGFISALHGKFCDSCNRIRMTAEGFIKPCLCYDTGISIKEAIRNHQPQKVRRLLAQAISEKPEAHCFEKKEEITEKREMSRIGG